MQEIIFIGDTLSAEKVLRRSNKNYLGIILGDKNEAIATLLKSGRLVDKTGEYAALFSRDTFLQEYLHLIGDCGERYHSIDWWVTFVASKNRFVSSLPEKLFQFSSLVHMIERYPEESMMIISPDRDVAKAFKKISKATNQMVAVIDNTFQVWCAAIKIFFEPFANKLEVIASLVVRHIVAKFYLEAYVRKSLSRSEQYIVTKTFVYESSFDAQNNYSDAFFTELPRYLVRQGKKVITIGNIVGNYAQIVRRIGHCQSDAVLIPQEYFISLREIFVAAWRLWRTKLHFNERLDTFGGAQTPPFKAGKECAALSINPEQTAGFSPGYRRIDFFGSDIASFIASEIKSEYKKGFPIRQYAYFFFMKNLLKSVTVDALYIPYENNPWEKMFTLAVRQFSPKTKIVGYQHTVIPQASANMFLSTQEEAVAPLPDTVLTVGKTPLEIMKRYGHYHRVELAAACALRFDYLFKLTLQARTHYKRLLVALEGVPAVTDVVNYVLSQYPRDKGLQLVIRTHPALPLANIRSRIHFPIEMMNHVTISENKLLKDDIMACDSVLYWGSSVGIEALMMGKPIIHFDNQTVLSFDPLFESPHFKWVVTKNDSLVRVVGEIEAMSDEAFYAQQKKGREYCEHYFFPINEERLQTFLNA